MEGVSEQLNAPTNDGGGSDISERLFSNGICSALTFAKRLSGPDEYSLRTWITSDATLYKATAVNWEQKQYMVVDVQSLLGPFQHRSGSSLTIQHQELAIAIYWVAAWAELDQSCDVFLMRMDNHNAAGWVQKGKALVGLSRGILGAFLYY